MADETSNLPRLRIETGAHNGRVLGCDVDAALTLLLTAGDDKTARLWSLPDLRPHGVLRPPIGDGAAGSLMAAALSPDGTLAAVGGFAGDTALPTVYLFDVARRRPVHAIPVGEQVGQTVQALMFAPDGARLIVGASHGLFVYRSGDWAQVGHDVHTASFAALACHAGSSTMAAAASDGLRLYDMRFLHGDFAPWKTVPGLAPGTGLAFSADGNRLAIGCYAPRVEVREVPELTLLQTPTLDGLLDQVTFNAIAWLGDGALIGGGFTCVEELRWTVLRWQDGGSGARDEAVAAPLGSDIGYLRDLGPRGLLVVTRLGEIVVHGLDGQRQASVLPLRADLRADFDSVDGQLFRASHDGTIVAWTTCPQWPPRGFDGESLRPRFGPDALIPGLAQATEVAAEIRLVGRSDNSPAVVFEDGRRLELDGRYQEIQAMDLRGEHVLIGGHSLLLRYALINPTARTERRLPDAATRVIQSGDGALAVAALRDGTIRWYQLPDLVELLAVFVTEEAQPRTVAFTPSGYYAASLGAEDLIGWHLERGPDRVAEFHPASAFRERFHRPDVVGRVLGKHDEDAALRAADAARGQAPGKAAAAPLATLAADAPPTVTLLVPRDGALMPEDGGVVIVAEVRAPKGRIVDKVRVRANDGVREAVDLWKPLPLATSSADETALLYGMRVELGAEPGREVSLAVAAEYGDWRYTAPAVLKLMRPPRAQAAASDKPRLFALLAGVSAYDTSGLRDGVRHSAKDATDLAAALKSHQGSLYREVNIACLTDAQVTQEELFNKLRWLKDASANTDTALVFLSGHGVKDDLNDYWFLTPNATAKEPNRGLSGKDLTKRVASIGARRLVLLDTCYAGAAGAAPPEWAPNQIGLANALHSEGVPVLGATLGNRRAIERADLAQGVFTHALLQVLKARDPEPLHLSTLWPALSERVQTLTDNKQEVAFLNAGNGADLALLAGRA